MKRTLPIFVVLLLAGTAFSAEVKTNFFPYPYEKVTLENGFSAYLIPVKGSGLVAYSSVVRTGGRDEWEPGMSGFAHFFEHMMFRGSKNYPAPVYEQMVTYTGAIVSAHTRDDYTAYNLVFPSRYLPTIMTLESDRFRNLSYDESAFESEAGAVHAEYLKSRVNPYAVLHEEVLNLAFDVHPYKYPPIGFEKDIQRMRKEYGFSLSFFHRYYRPENIVLLMAGDFAPGLARHLIERYYGGWKPGYVPPQITPEPEQTEERFKEVAYDGKTLPIVWIAYKGDAFDPADKLIPAATLLGELAFGESSDTYEQLILRERKVESLQAFFPFRRDPGLLSVYAQVKDEKDIPYAREAIDRTVEKFKSTPVDPARLEDVKRHARYRFLMDLETPKSIVESLARFVALTGTIEGVATLNASLERVTPADILAAAARYFQKERRTVVVLKGARR